MNVVVQADPTEAASTLPAAVSDARLLYPGAGEILDVMPERVIRYRVADLMVSYCNGA
jgi:hypothetical protein